MDGDTKVNADPVSSSQDQSHAPHVDNKEETEPNQKEEKIAREVADKE